MGMGWLCLGTIWMPSHLLGSGNTEGPVRVGVLFPVVSRLGHEIMNDPNQGISESERIYGN